MEIEWDIDEEQDNDISKGSSASNILRGEYLDDDYDYEEEYD
jgi:hypothetical protein